MTGRAALTECAGVWRDARVLADVGGTNARFAWQPHQEAAIEAVHTLRCADHATLADALHAYLVWAERPVPPACAIAIANPVVGDWVSMTNHHWAFSIAQLKAQLGFHRLVVINDFAALAIAIPALPAQELHQIGGMAPLPGSAIALIGPGTGLGVSGLLPNGQGGWVAVQGEGGHVTLGGTTPRERAVLAALEARYGHASAERAVCGQAIIDIRTALGELDRVGHALVHATAAEITAVALEGGDPLCVEALNLFCAFLGQAASNLALTLGAKGGVYVGGGIVPRLGGFVDVSPFRARFDTKGRLSKYLADIPVFVIRSPQSPALLGAARALDGSG